jgi:hypothetical protein
MFKGHAWVACPQTATVARAALQAVQMRLAGGFGVGDAFRQSRLICGFVKQTVATPDYAS